MAHFYVRDQWISLIEFAHDCRARIFVVVECDIERSVIYLFNTLNRTIFCEDFLNLSMCGFLQGRYLF